MFWEDEFGNLVLPAVLPSAVGIWNSEILNLVFGIWYLVFGIWYLVFVMPLAVLHVFYDCHPVY